MSKSKKVNVGSKSDPILSNYSREKFKMWRVVKAIETLQPGEYIFLNIKNQSVEFSLRPVMTAADFGHEITYHGDVMQILNVSEDV
jgi:hypothetical protein